ncbi:MAG: hypothetical protein M1817_002070 [Caeruleum heppii]|nr:MAG: hypothetical protein M1817_002070 [Caeruleum heppii]
MDTHIVLPQASTSPQDGIQAMTDLLENAISQRARFYKNVHAFTIRFEADDTSAYRDARHFQQMLRSLGFPIASEIIISATDPTPSWTFLQAIGTIAKRITEQSGRTLLLGHYAGHAMVNAQDQLAFFASPAKPRAMTFKSTFQSVFFGNDFGLDQTDVVLILDSCFSGLATRGLLDQDRSVEILASVGTTQQALGNHPDLARVQNRTFTSRLTDEVVRRVGRRNTSSVSFAEVVGELRRQSHAQRLPQYHLHLGKLGIRIPILREQTWDRRQDSLSETSWSSQDDGRASTIPPYRAVFTIHLPSATVGSQELEKFLEWLQSLDSSIGLELTGVYEARSVKLMLEADWHIWAKLAGHQNLSLVCDVFGQNRLKDFLPKHQLPEEQQPHGRMTQLPLRNVENIPRQSQREPPSPEKGSKTVL